MRRLVWFMLVAAVLVAGSMEAGQGYVVVLKSGHKIPCREPMRIEGPNALMVLVTGVLTSYPLSQVDIVETERYNKLGLGDALLIEELSLSDKPPATPTPTISLGKYASIDASRRNPELGSTAEPTPTPTPGIKLHPDPYPDERIDQAFTRFFDDSNLYIYRTSVGTRPNYFFVQAVTDTEREVFDALRIVTEAFLVIHRIHPEIAPSAVELEMTQTTGKAAGTFRITPEMATELAERKSPVEQFYVNYVIF